MDRICTIYLLKDPNTNEVRYIGQTFKSLTARLSLHRSSRVNGEKFEWVKLLAENNKLPIIEAIETVNQSEALEREAYWINHYKNIGADLLNLSVGRPKVDKPLVARSFKVDIDELNKAIEIHGKMVVSQKIREFIKRLAKKKFK